MIKRLLALALALACVPPAYAFPPCPSTPFEFIPLEGSSPPQSQSGLEPWFRATYSFAGTPEVIHGLVTSSPSRPGQCSRDLPSPLENYASTSGGVIQLDPAYAPGGGLGLVALPEMSVIAQNGMRITYQLDFSVDNRRLAHMLDWMDLAQLEFARERVDGGDNEHVVSSVYRVRKTQPGNGAARLEVIASRSLPSADGQWPLLLDQVVAVVPMLDASGDTPVALRWTQHVNARHPIDRQAKASNTIGIVPLGVDSVLQVIGADETVLHEITLPSQWASTLSMGLLDYTIEKPANYDKKSMVHLGAMMLKAHMDASSRIPAPATH